MREVHQEILAVREQQEAILQTQTLILAELRLLRCGAGRIDADSIEALLGYLHDSFGEAAWTSAEVFSEAAENRLVDAALTRCLGERGTVNGLGKLLMGSLGPTGDYFLRCVKKHGNAGAIFRVTECVTSSPAEPFTLNTQRR